MNAKKFLALTLALALVFALAGCRAKDPQPTDEPMPSPSDQAVESQTPERAQVNLAVLSGPTGVGAAKLLADNEAGASVNHYNVTLCTDNQQVMAGLTNGEFDIAAIATNVASTLYNKSDGAIQITAINTLGVLYILGPQDKPISSLAELKGKTLHAVGQGANPEYVLNYLLTENGVDPQDVDIVWGEADAVNAAMLQGQGGYCMLPVPAATALETKSEGKIKSYLSLSDEWDALQNGSQLTMGCMVARAQFVREHPEVVADFLEEYGASIDYVKENPEEMAQVVTDFGITPSVGIAKKAIPQCNLVCITEEDMRNTIQGYYEVLFAADPASIGGSIPDDGFYPTILWAKAP